MKNIRKMALLATIVSVLLPSGALLAQDQGLGDMMFTAGTVTSAGTPLRDWGWIQLMATSEDLLKDRPMDVYLKQGDMTSTNTFVLKGRMLQTTDVRTIGALLSRGEMLGENISNLEVAVDSLYAEASPASSLSLAEKISALVAGSQDDDELYKNLVFMGRAHPAISMIIGHGFACPIYSSGYSTLEIRAHSDNEVIGRITLQAGVPDILPAPGPIYRVQDTSPKGNLNIRLRWDVPSALKRVALLQFGYNVYRMDESFAVAHGYDTNPPSHIAIAGLVSNNTEVVKVNRMPILVDASAGDSNTWFVVDDNNRFSGGTPFVDGTKYYYFVSALDLLGRDGELSQGLMTYPCDRMAPTVPHDIRMRTISDYVSGVETQWVEISWAHDTNDTDTARYYVYRHNGLADMQSNAIYAVSNRISGPIVPAAGATRVYFEDRTLSSNDWGISYTYTVRAEDDASCGHNLSGNSPPAFGTMRKWHGPPAATGAVVNIQVESLGCWYTNLVKISLSAPYNAKLTCLRPVENCNITWAEFSYYDGDYRGAGSESSATALGRYYFRPYSDHVSKVFSIPNRDGAESQATFFCRVGSSNGNLSGYAHYTMLLGTYELIFGSGCNLQWKPVSGPNDVHIWGDPLQYPEILIPAVTNAVEYRLYRRVDGGLRTLVWQGEMDALLGALVRDYTGGAVNGSRICYYYQLFDQHGNAGPMTYICCFKTEARSDLPTPVLAKIDSTGSATNSPGMELNWFCAPPGVEYFDIALALDGGSLPAKFTTHNYPFFQDMTNEIAVVVDGETNTLKFGFYRTGRVGVSFGSTNSPQFVTDSSVELDRKYVIMVRAVGTAGAEGPWSNAEAFQWKSVPNPGDPVPWPAREMPVVQTETFNTNIAPAFLSQDNNDGIFGPSRIGVRVGKIPADDVTYANKDYYELDGTDDPVKYLYQNAAHTNQTVMPCVLYRYQLTNELYHTVSGDISQVSPMMEEIAYGQDSRRSQIYDPFIALARPLDSNDDWGLYLLDTQPVVRGAKYQYLILRFDEITKEMDRIIPAGTITVP